MKSVGITDCAETYQDRQGESGHERQEVSGHDFSRAARATESRWALPAAEKRPSEGGGGFNPRIKPAEIAPALAADGLSLRFQRKSRVFPQPLQPPKERIFKPGSVPFAPTSRSARLNAGRFQSPLSEADQNDEPETRDRTRAALLQRGRRSTAQCPAHL